MEDRLRRLEAVIADLSVRLELETVRELRVSTDQGERMHNTPEYIVLECEIRLSQMRARELRAKIVAAHTKLARLKVEAEIERLRSLQRPPNEAELAQLRRMSKKAVRDQRRLAIRVIRRACDFDRACKRYDGALPMPKRVPKQSPPQQVLPQQQPEVPKQQHQEPMRQQRRR